MPFHHSFAQCRAISQNASSIVQRRGLCGIDIDFVNVGQALISLFSRAHVARTCPGIRSRCWPLTVHDFLSAIVPRTGLAHASATSGRARPVRRGRENAFACQWVVKLSHLAQAVELPGLCDIVTAHH